MDSKTRWWTTRDLGTSEDPRDHAPNPGASCRPVAGPLGHAPSCVRAARSMRMRPHLDDLPAGALRRSITSSSSSIRHLSHQKPSQNLVLVFLSAVRNTIAAAAAESCFPRQTVTALPIL
jgi:hypothetical protein